MTITIEPKEIAELAKLFTSQSRLNSVSPQEILDGVRKKIEELRSQYLVSSIRAAVPSDN